MYMTFCCVNAWDIFDRCEVCSSHQFESSKTFGPSLPVSLGGSVLYPDGTVFGKFNFTGVVS